MTKSTLDERICFNLYNLQRQINRFYNKSILNEMDITYPQFLVLNILQDKKQVNIKTLAKMLRLDTGTISPLIRRMEKLDLVHRWRDADDQRLVYIEATERGKKLEEKLDKSFESFSEAIDIAPEEEEALLAHIKHIDAMLTKNAFRN
ncbi:MarR family winged helix-turn-helix transcriptional regulator [Salinicoccus hispanicus]|uniref:HTH-type transcriptional regulator MgrA n=1 Tax=Salinicoccus hispanicus TaxID=157225 RepID=A0A6N8U071_9STAP|nr:MarR family transcriptional regulator [Salinicoccus hispanicus]MXQ50697.1 MarR family transcriptional regulator [Salinicoccus hispanicus]